MIYEAAWSEKQVILQNIKIIGIFKIKEKLRIITIYPKNILNYKLQVMRNIGRPLREWI